MSQKPNIIFIQNDHQAYYHWEWENGPVPMRPNFMKLAAEGACFTHSYCATPLCGPTRRTMLTGLFARTMRAYSLTASSKASVPLGSSSSPSGPTSSAVSKEHRQRGNDADQFFHNSKFEIKSRHN